MHLTRWWFACSIRTIGKTVRPKRVRTANAGATKQRYETFTGQRSLKHMVRLVSRTHHVPTCPSITMADFPARCTTCLPWASSALIAEPRSTNFRSSPRLTARSTAATATATTAKMRLVPELPVAASAPAATGASLLVSRLTSHPWASSALIAEPRSPNFRSSPRLTARSTAATATAIAVSPSAAKHG